MISFIRSMQTLGELYFVPDHVLGTGNALGDTADGAVASVAFVVNSRCGGDQKACCGAEGSKG